VLIWHIVRVSVSTGSGRISHHRRISSAAGLNDRFFVGSGMSSRMHSRLNTTTTGHRRMGSSGSAVFSQSLVEHGGLLHISEAVEQEEAVIRDEIAARRATSIRDLIPTLYRDAFETLTQYCVSNINISAGLIVYLIR
jgi:hypothetical protein